MNCLLCESPFVTVKNTKGDIHTKCLQCGKEVDWVRNYPRRPFLFDADFQVTGRFIVGATNAGSVLIPLDGVWHSYDDRPPIVNRRDKEVYR